MINRRQFLRTSSCAALVTGAGGLSQVLQAAPQAESELGKVKVVDVQTATIRFRYDMHLVKVITDSGLYGIGEAYNRGGVINHIQNIKRHVIGQDPLMVDVLTQKMMDSGVGQGSLSGSLTGAISGIETALWDVAGKILEVPVYVLLGGRFRDKVLLYHDTGSPNTVDPKPWVEEAKKTREFGFRTTKFDLNPFGGERWNRAVGSEDLKAWIRILEAIRDYLGPDFPLGVDFHWKLNTHIAKQFVDMARHLNLWFVEDPMPPGNADAFVRLTAMSPIPIATGENLFTRQTFRPYIEQQACDIIQPDTQKCGGLLETKRIADWANLYYLNMLCHNMCSPVGTIASGHACLAIRSFVALESDSVEIPDWQHVVQWDGPLYKDGYLEIPNKPGLGIELNEDVCRKHLTPGSRLFS